MTHVSILISLLISTHRHSFLLDSTWRPAGVSILSLPGAHDHNTVNTSSMDHSPYCHILPQHPTCLLSVFSPGWASLPISNSTSQKPEIHLLLLIQFPPHSHLSESPDPRNALHSISNLLILPHPHYPNSGPCLSIISLPASSFFPFTSALKL